MLGGWVLGVDGACARWSSSPGEKTNGAQASAPDLNGSAQALGRGARKSDAGASEGARPPNTGRRELTWSFAQGPFGPMDVAISIPVAPAGQRFPVLIALHGRGESVKGRQRGARAWLDDYQLERAMSRLMTPPLSAADFQDFVSEERLLRLNRGLIEHPYAGLIVVCPSLADVLKGESAFKEAEPLAKFLVDVLLPRVYARTPALGTRASTGIDGVSLGGRASLLVGLRRPLAFGSVGALQAAIDRGEVERFAELGALARAQNPELILRLLTSDEDYFQLVNRRLSSALEQRGVAHELTRVQGTHSYRFNKGPGALEMLMYHDRVLRGLPPP